MLSLSYFVGTAASFTAKISSFETVANEKPFWIPYQNSEYPRIFGVTGANQNVQKLLSTDLVNTNMPVWVNFFIEDTTSRWKAVPEWRIVLISQPQPWASQETKVIAKWDSPL